jgi:hypothetical protein
MSNLATALLSVGLLFSSLWVSRFRAFHGRRDANDARRLSAGPERRVVRAAASGGPGSLHVPDHLRTQPSRHAVRVRTAPLRSRAGRTEPLLSSSVMAGQCSGAAASCALPPADAGRITSRLEPRHDPLRSAFSLRRAAAPAVHRDPPRAQSTSPLHSRPCRSWAASTSTSASATARWQPSGPSRPTPTTSRGAPTTTASLWLRVCKTVAIAAAR